MKKYFSLFLVVLMVSAVLLGCSGKTATTSDAPATKEKDTLVIAVNEDISGLDPFAQNTSLQNGYTILMYDTLLSLNPQTGAVEKNGLATDYEIVSATEYIFHLREGVKFHEGQTLTAEDVKYSIERAAASNGMASKVSQVDHVEVIDPLTVRIVLNTPSTTILNNLAFCGTSIFCKEWDEAHKDSFKHNGTGPYKFVDWKSGESFEVTRFDGYWGNNPGKMKNLKFMVMTENNARTIALETGEVDVNATVAEVDFERFQKDDNITVYSEPSTWVYFLCLNNAKGATKDRAVREAIAHAINKQDVIDVFLEGHGSVKNVPIGDGQSYCDNSIPGYEYDVELAKKMLAEAGYADGFDMILTSSEQNLPASQVVQAQLQAIGINAKIEQMEYAAREQRALAGDMEGIIDSWQPATSDADNPLRNLLYSTSTWANNECYYNNPEYDKLLDAALVETDPAKAQDLYTQVQQLIYEDVPLIPIFARMWTVAARNEVKGIQIPAVGDAMIYRSMYWEN